MPKTEDQVKADREAAQAHAYSVLKSIADDVNAPTADRIHAVTLILQIEGLL
jgi:uncharacterized protein (UPF0147 family)